MLLCLVGCGPGTRAPVNDPSEFVPFFKKFEQYAGEHGRPTPPVTNFMAIGFGPTQDADVAGFCEWSFMNGRRIVINQKEWEQLTDTSRESLVFHELGHCVLKRGHLEDTVQGTDAGVTDEGVYPKSLMNPELVPGEIYMHLQDYYLKELFGG